MICQLNFLITHMEFLHGHYHLILHSLQVTNVGFSDLEFGIIIIVMQFYQIVMII